MKPFKHVQPAAWLRLVTGAAACAALAATAAAQNSADWPQFHGPNRDAMSRETGLLKTWPESGPALLWKATGLGTGFSSVSIAGGRIFTMGDLAGEDGAKKQYVIALDLASHKRAWTAPVGAPNGDGPRCTPTVAGDLVYALGTDGDLVCVEAATGKERWRKSLPNDFGGKMMSMWKFSESPLIDGEKVICTPGSPEALLVALNRQTGELIWKCSAPNLGSAGRDGAGYSSVVAVTMDGVRQYVQMVGRGVVGVQASDGKLLWSYNGGTNGTANITTPVIRGNDVFATSAYGAGSGLVHVTGSNGAFQAQEAYRIKANDFSNHHGGVVLVGNYIYGGHGQNAGAPTCVDWKTGKVVWQAPPVSGGSASVFYADGNLIFAYDTNVLALVQATPSGFHLAGKFSPPAMPGTLWAHPVVLGGKLYLRHDDALFCYNLKRG